MSAFPPLPTGRTISLMPTWQCTAECQDCGTMSSPRVRERLTMDQLIKAIGEASRAGYEVAVFTGGEPTLAGAVLEKALAYARDCGLITRVVTNGHWARSPERADLKIRSLVEAGLQEINFSTGDEHVRFVPVERVLRGVVSALRAGLTTAVMVELRSGNRVTRESFESHPLYTEIADMGGVKIDESPWMPLDPDQSEGYPAGFAVNRENLSTRTGCDSVLQTTTIEADGTIGACCGIGMRLVPELQLGHIANMSISEADSAAADDFLKRWIRVEGPEKILAWAASIDTSIEWEDRYAHRCQACIRLYRDPLVGKVVREHHAEKIADVVFGEWLLYHYKGAEPLDAADEAGMREPDIV